MQEIFLNVENLVGVFVLGVRVCTWKYVGTGFERRRGPDRSPPSLVLSTSPAGAAVHGWRKPTRPGTVAGARQGLRIVGWQSGLGGDLSWLPSVPPFLRGEKKPAAVP